MFKKPRPQDLNGIDEIIQQSDESKARRGRAARTLIVELEDRRKKRDEQDNNEQIETYRRLGAI